MAANVSRAWRGVLYPGETLFLPGDMIHAVRNVCPSTLSICRRSWRASMVRDIAQDSAALFADTEPAAILNRNPFFRIVAAAQDFFAGWRTDPGSTNFSPFKG